MRKRNCVISLILGGVLGLVFTGTSMAAQTCPIAAAPPGLQAAMYIRGLINLTTINWEKFRPSEDYITILYPDPMAKKPRYQVLIWKQVPGFSIELAKLNKIIDTVIDTVETTLTIDGKKVTYDLRSSDGIRDYIEASLKSLYLALMTQVYSNLERLVQEAYVEREGKKIFLRDALSKLLKAGEDVEGLLAAYKDKIKVGEGIKDIITDIVDFKVPLVAKIGEYLAQEFTILDAGMAGVLSHWAELAKSIAKQRSITPEAAISEVKQRLDNCIALKDAVQTHIFGPRKMNLVYGEEGTILSLFANLSLLGKKSDDIKETISGFSGKMREYRDQIAQDADTLAYLKGKTDAGKNAEIVAKFATLVLNEAIKEINKITIEDFKRRNSGDKELVSSTLYDPDYKEKLDEMLRNALGKALEGKAQGFMQTKNRERKAVETVALEFVKDYYISTLVKIKEAFETKFGTVDVYIPAHEAVLFGWTNKVFFIMENHDKTRSDAERIVIGEIKNLNSSPFALADSTFAADYLAPPPKKDEGFAFGSLPVVPGLNTSLFPGLN